MPTNHHQTGERGAALLAALMMLVVVSAIAVFIASTTTATANDIQQHTSTQDEYWAAKSMAETVEASARTDLPTAYDLEMRQARAATFGTNVAVFDLPTVPPEQSQPVYDPTAWVVTFKPDGTIAVAGKKLRPPAGASSLFGNLGLWLNTHKAVPVTYAANRGYSPTKMSLSLNEAYRLTPNAGTAEPQYVVQFGVDAQAGVGGRVRQTGLITLGPPLQLTPDDPCSSLAANMTAVALSGKGGSTSYVLTITYTRATHLTVMAANGGAVTTLYDNDVTDDPKQQTLTVNTPAYASRTVFTLTASNRSTSGATCSVVRQVIVQDCPPGTYSFTASPASIAPGQSSTLTWNVTGATSVTITGPSVNYTGPASGSLVVKPTVTSTYNLTSASSGGAGCPGASGSVTVVVCTNTPVINSFQAQPTTISAGQNSTLSWNVSNADSVTITPSVGSVAASGSTPVSPSATTTYTITATSTCGTVTANVTVTVCTGPPVINSYSISPMLIAPGEEATISWSVTGATQVQITPTVGQVPASGQYTVSPPQTTSYTIIASNPCGQRQQTITLSVHDDEGGGGSGGERKVWCDTTIIGTTRQYTRFAVTPAPSGDLSVSGLIVVTPTDPTGSFPCSPIVSAEPFDPRTPAWVWLTVIGQGFQRYPATICCFRYGPGAEWSIFVTVDTLFQSTDQFADSMNVQGILRLNGNNGCTYDYNYSVGPYARGSCPPRGPFGRLTQPAKSGDSALLAACALASREAESQSDLLDVILPGRNRLFNF